MLYVIYLDLCEVNSKKGKVGYTGSENRKDNSYQDI